MENEHIKPIRCRDTREFSPEHTKLVADSDFDESFQVNVIGAVTEKLPGFDINCLKASAAHYSSVANGEVDGVIECTRKGNLEIATAYGLATEAGGVMVILDGESLGSKKYLEFGQGEREYIPVISAATASLARDLTDRISLQ